MTAGVSKHVKEEMELRSDGASVLKLTETHLLLTPDRTHGRGLTRHNSVFKPVNTHEHVI